MTATTDVPAGLEAFLIEAPKGPEQFNVLTESDALRFWHKVKKSEGDACWQWIGAFFSTGYPAFWLRGTNVGGHRVMCAMHYGLSRGRSALHSCDNPGCVNPRHLRWGTPADNMRDRSERGRAPWGETHPNAKFTAAQVADIRDQYARGVGRRTLADTYDVTYQAIDAIVKGKNWSGE
jgi:hypothetical protein